MGQKVKIIIAGIVVFVIGASLGFLVEYEYSYQQTKQLIAGISPIRENNFNYKYIFPLLRYDFGNAKYFLENKTLEQKINAYIKQQYQAKNAQSISVYFSDFLNNQWSGVNENVQYYPGSMMKVLIMMDYYREEQLDPSIKQKVLVYSNDIDQTLRASALATPSNLTVGKGYTVEQLVENMIENSDNGAETLLLANDNRTILNAIYKDLNIPGPVNGKDFTISARDYSVFLRVLYNSTYLSEANSEAALSIMSQSTYKDGIYSGVPSNVAIAQKYGESLDTDSQGKTITGTELHDCGIVYARNSPYTLCIMTRAKGVVDQKQLATIIKDISAIVYNYVTSSGGK